MLIETRNMKIPGPWLKLNAAAGIASFGIVVAAPQLALKSYGRMVVVLPMIFSSST